MSKVNSLNKHFMVRLARLIVPSNKQQSIDVLVEDFELNDEAEERYGWALDAFHLALRERHRQIWQVFFITPRRAFWSSLALAVFLSSLVAMIFLPIVSSKVRAKYASELIQNSLLDAKVCREKPEPGKCMENALGKISSLQLRVVNSDLQDEYKNFKDQVGFYKQEANIDNPILEEVIRKELSIQNIPLMQGHLREITELSLNNVQEFRSLNYLPANAIHNLRRLSVQNVEISNLTPLEGLGKLQELDLSNTQVSDLTSLTKLNDLEKLKLSKTQIEDLSVLNQLDNLQSLSLSYTKVYNLTPLAELPKLEELFLANTEVSNLEPLAELHSLKRLYLSTSKEESLQPIKELWNKGLEVYLNGDQISNLNDISATQRLENRITIGIVTFLPEKNEKEEDWDANEEFIGKHAKDAAEIVIKAINEGEIPSLEGTFGPGGTRVDLAFLDEEVEISEKNYRQWVEKENIDVIVGYVLSGNCEKIVPIAEKLEILTVLSTCGTLKIFEEIETNPKYLFRTASHAMLDSVSMARYLEKHYPELKHISGLNPNYSWGLDSWRYFQDSLQEFLKVEDYTSVFVNVGTKEYCKNISDLENHRPEIVFSSFSVSDLIELTNSIEDCSFPPNIALAVPTGLSILPRFKELLGTKIKSPIIVGARGVPSKFVSEDKVSDQWLEKQFKGKYEPNYYAYRMAQALFGVKAAYEKAFGDTGKLPETDDVIKAFERLEYDSPSGKIVMALANGHQAVQSTAVATLRVAPDGRPIIENAEYFDMWCVNPPPNVTGSKWVDSGFKGAKCD